MKTRRQTGSPWLEGDRKKRMLRGGTWDWSANMLRSGYRETAIVDGGGYSFRVVRTLNVQPQGRLHVGAFSLSGDDRLLGAAQ